MSVEPALQPALARLERICQKRPELGPLGRINAQLLPALFAPDRTAPAGAIVLPDTHGVPEGVPVFRSTPPALSELQLRSFWTGICRILSASDLATAAGPLEQAVATGSVQVTELLARVLSGSPDRCRDLLLDLRLDAALGFTVLRLSSLPMLAPIAQQLEIRLLRRRWDRGDCPTCGNGPLLAELRGLEQFRWLRCGWCASQWQCDRLVCPFCGNRDHGQLREVVVEGHEDACRLNICDACGESLPTVATLTRLSPPALLVAEMETLHLRLLGP